MKKLNYINVFIPLITSILLILLGCNNSLNKKIICSKYPQLKSVPVIDNYFGKKIIDDYHYLETDTSLLVRNWIKNQNSLYDSLLNRIELKDTIKRLLIDAVYSSKIRGGFPRVIDNKLFFMKIDIESQEQKIITKDSLTGIDIELFSTKLLNDSLVNYSIDFFEPSFDGKHIGVGLSSNTSENTFIKIIDVICKKILPEKIERVIYGYPSWLIDGSGFYYSQLKEIKSTLDEKTMYENSTVKLHKLNTESVMDVVTFSKDNNPELNLENLDFPTMTAFPSSNKDLVYVEKGSSTYKSIFVCEKQNLMTENTSKRKWKKIYCEEDKIESLTMRGGNLYVISFKENPNGNLIKLDLNDSVLKPEVMVTGESEVLENIMQTKKFLYLKKNRNGISLLVQLDFNTPIKQIIELPFKGNIYIKPATGVSSNYSHSDNLFFGMESWDKELAIYECNRLTLNVTKTTLRQQGKYGNLQNIVVKEIEIPSYDGTLIPLSIIYMNNINLNGINPTLLEGYGAYGVSINSKFQLSILPWLKMGGVYAVAHVRGGGEKGELWYKGGYKSTKANSWKDFIACGEFLIREKYTCSNKLAAIGSSAGGITVGRAITEKPLLFKAAIIEVGALNMLRLENSHNTFGISEFGTVKYPQEFNYLYNMDVYHHIKKGIKYPSLLITAGLNDTKVDWWSPAKAVARFQNFNSCMNNIILFNINTAGHDGGTNIIEDFANYYSFLFWQLDQNK